MPAALHDRLQRFYGDLEKSGRTDHVSVQVGKIFNALLAEVKQTHEDDPIASAIEPLTFESRSVNDVATLAISVGQLLQAIR